MISATGRKNDNFALEEQISEVMPIYFFSTGSTIHNVNLVSEPPSLRNKHLVDHTKKQNMLYCKLTGRSIRNETIHIQRHLKGKKFKRSLEYCKSIVCTNNRVIVMAFVSNNISYVHT